MSEQVVWDALRGALVTRALGIVADLDVAGALADGPRRVEELAAQLDADADALFRVLRALASDGIFIEDPPRMFGNTEASEVLRDESWRSFAHLFGGVWMRPVAELTANGTSTFPGIHGTDFWSWLADSPAERAAFDRAMEQGWERRVERLSSVDWRGEETVVDVGGGNGSLLLPFLERHPGMRGIVFDLPETIRDESAFGGRCSFVAGSFFDTVPDGGDAYVLSTVLHDWDDESAVAILRTVRAAAGNGARLVLLEDTVASSGNEPDGTKWLDLLMLALFAGRERDESQWRALIERGGFRVEDIRDGVIEARCL
jgi:hypothetical protein